ncbi:cytochrome b561 and DOMON domain-containing protein At5g47530-like [Cornus florida]|uniref:cytochrome b561 and DOMON domain-containing protein At5g47530-like n=1 Tax=Cornus florida TaxID=4283 RepID=UPI00289A74A6|nr:cytochrome b561 and DOMON domain-containing protein At5g47530-like [Cornus florida]
MATTLLLFCILASLFLISHAQTCSNYTFSSNRAFTSCTDLPHLQAHLHWNYIPSTGKLEIAYRANQTSNGWVAWAINPTDTGMVGSQALVAFQNANGTMTVYPTPITSYSPSMLPGTLSFQVSNISAEYSNKEMMIFADVGPLDNGTVVNLVWQAGSSVTNNVPQVHSMSMPNLHSMGALNFLSD